MVWGESLLKHRLLLAVSLIRQIIVVAGHDIPVSTQVILLGEASQYPLGCAPVPLVVIITIILGATMVPAASIIQEKEKRTLTALTITPATLGDVLTSKAIAGALLSIAMGLVILALNRAFGAEPGLLVLVVVLSAIFAAVLGVILGMLVDDINTLFTVVKSAGILIYAPALVILFPQIPEWVARIFPTYYMIGPIVEMSLNGAGWAEITPDIAILGALIVAAGAVARIIARRSGEGRTPVEKDNGRARAAA